jgi:hypothetical protein
MLAFFVRPEEELYALPLPVTTVTLAVAGCGPLYCGCCVCGEKAGGEIPSCPLY